MKFWHKDKMLCKNRPLLPPGIKEEPSTMVSFTAEDKAAPSTQIKREVGSSNMWKGKKQCEEEFAKHNEFTIEASLADANKALKHQPYDLVVLYTVLT